MPTLTTSPNPAPPSALVAVAGAGFVNAKTRLLLDGAGATTNIFRPRKDGTFNVGITVSATAKTQTLIAQQQVSGTWGEVARTSVAVQAIVVPPPGDTTKPVISALQATQAGVVSWSLSEPGTGQVDYGPTTSYGSLSTHEPSLLTAHVQTLSPLSAATTYYYRVRSKDAAGNEAVSAGGTFTTLGATPPPPDPTPEPPPPTAYPSDRTLSYVPVRTLARPGYRVAISEPDWGTQIKRISDTNMWRNAYATTQPWSKNDRYAYLGYGRRLLDGLTYADLGARTGLELWLWSHTDEDVAYGIGTGPGGFNTAFLRHRVAANAFTVIRNFNATYPDQPFAYSFLDPGGYDTNIALDDHRVAFIGRRAAGGTWDIIVFDPIDDQVDAIYNVGSTQPLMAKMAWSGQYVIAVTAGGTKAYTISGGTLAVHRSLHSGTPHQDVARNAALQDVWISTVAPISSIRLSDGLVTNLGVGTTSGPPDIPSFSYGHVSGQCVDWPGWLVASGGIHYGNTQLKGTDQLVALKLDGSGTVKIFGFSRALMSTVDYDYNRVPFAVPNPAGTKVMWGSDWQGSEVFGYVAGMAP